MALGLNGMQSEDACHVHYYRIALLSRVDFPHLTRVSARDRYRATANYLVVACGPARDRR